MSDYDMMLARGVSDGFLNIAIGENHILQKNLVLPSRKTSRGEQQYPAPQGDPILIKQLQEMNPGMCIVVANGAKQALSAALYALHDSTKHIVYHPAPYWPSFPTLAKMERLDFTSDKSIYEHLQIKVLTLPNNPNGYRPWEAPNQPVCDIWDAAYASNSLYGFQQKHEPKYKIKVESASKMLGLSGSRIGWATTYDAYLASRMSEYVELHTSGVCVPAQRKVAACLANLDKLQNGFEKSRRELLVNGDILWSALGGFVDQVEGVPDTGTGMFAWVRLFPDVALRFEKALETTKVRMIKGEACGAAGWWRISMGQLNDITYQALNAIRKEVHANH